MISQKIAEDGHILYGGLRSHHWLPDGTRIEIEKGKDGVPQCWYRYISTPFGWGVLEVLSTQQVKERLRL